MVSSNPADHHGVTLIHPVWPGEDGEVVGRAEQNAELNVVAQRVCVIRNTDACDADVRAYRNILYGRERFGTRASNVSQDGGKLFVVCRENVDVLRSFAGGDSHDSFDGNEIENVLALAELLPRYVFCAYWRRRPAVSDLTRSQIQKTVAQGGKTGGLGFVANVDGAGDSRADPYAAFVILQNHGCARLVIRYHACHS